MPPYLDEPRYLSPERRSVQERLVLGVDHDVGAAVDRLVDDAHGE
jgi:hypothetical protein